VAVRTDSCVRYPTWRTRRNDAQVLFAFT